MSGEGLVQPSIIQMKGQSTAQSVDAPMTALTQQQAHYLMEPEVRMIDHQRRTGVAKSLDDPLRTVTAGGQHQALAEAFMFAIDQSGGDRKNDGTYSVDQPMRTLVTKHNQACIEMELEEVSDRFLQACSERGVDTTRATTFLGFLVDELKRKGKVDAKPWIYVYYSSGSEGKHIDEPLPAVRTKAGHALVYPVVERDGRLIRIDLFYRMLTPLELQRAMGFPDDMQWGGCTKTQIIRAIGNSVSRGVARALGLAWYSQDSNVWEKVKHLYP
jgi:DNA (cytosine-5)-methyltransferase 1